MGIDSTFFSYFLSASPVVKTVMLLLLSASMISWFIIFQRWFCLRDAREQLSKFEESYWSCSDMTELYKTIAAKENVDGIEKIFIEGSKEFGRLRKKQGIHPDAIIEGAGRAMRVAQMHVTEDLERHLSFLATVGSTSPYIGLFGTVWGIMTAFQALGNVSQATIAMVAPGISEALVATAMGLFAAIPAVIAYNRYANLVERVMTRYEAFQEEFSSYLYRQLSSST